MTIEQYRRIVTERLYSVFDHREADAAARAILADAAGYDTKFLVMNGGREIVPETAGRIDEVVDRVLQGMPVQYATGHAHFAGLDFEVTPAVLIPRPETAQLVDMIVDAYAGHKESKILEVGTGSGCISCALARALPFPEITAIDISSVAVEVARRNAKRLGVDVDFRIDDMLKPCTLAGKSFDIIVSNPPYITPEEADDMERRVLAYEPNTALFVPADDPLIFVRALCTLAVERLDDGGALYIEINPILADESAALAESMGLRDVTVIRDYIGRKRFLSAHK